MAPENFGSSKEKFKTVLITGGNSGIGLETARQLLEVGSYRLVLLGKDPVKLEDAIRQLAGEFPSRADQLSTVKLDLSKTSEIQKAVDKIGATHRSIYGLVNNAGVYPFGNIRTTTEDAWDETLSVNLKAPFALMQAVLPLMQKSAEGGRIVNVSSTAGLLPNHFALAYSVSKAALLALTRTVAKELGKDGITVNCVCPGIVRTPLHEAYHANQRELEEFYKKRGATFPLGRVGEPKDVASAIKFFLSEEAQWITGDVLVVDGGRLLL